MEIIQSYYNSTPNEENKAKQITFNSNITSSESSSLDSSKNSKFSVDQKLTSIVDASLLMHVLDLLSNLLKKTDRETHLEDFNKIIVVFP